MTIEEVERRLRVIASMGSDPEAAHSWEDDPQILASAALRSLDVEFERWCA